MNLSAKKVLRSTEVAEDEEAKLSCVVNTAGPSISSLRVLRSSVGSVNFASIVYCLMVGRQVVVRGQPPTLVASILFTLKVSFL